MESLEEMLLKPAPEKVEKVEEVKTEIVEPIAADVPPSEEPKPKRSRREKIPNGEVIPRRKKGAKEEEVKVLETQPAEFFANQLFGLHQIAALMTGLPVQITEEDSKKLGDAVHGVVKQYDLSWLTKFTPIFNLMIVVAVVEAPVIMKAQAVVNAKRQASKPQPFKAVNATIEGGLPVKDSTTDVPKTDVSGGGFANVSDMKGVELKRE